MAAIETIAAGKRHDVTSLETKSFDLNLRKIVLAIFFLSGFSGLVYQVVWVRMMGLVFGTTVYAVSTVLTAFMSGLALGSFLYGRFIDRGKNPLAVYGRLEIAI